MESAIPDNSTAGVLKNLSYSYENPYPDQNSVSSGFKLNTSISAEFAVASDLNPGSTGTNDNVLAVSTTSSARDMKQGNSNNHDEDGQNVLYGDGHVEFQQNPFCGTQRDMIYWRRASGANQFLSDNAAANGGAPYDANDSVLLPYD